MNCYESRDNKIKDKFYFICDDKINDMVVAPVAGQMVLNPVLACQDNTLRVMMDTKNEVLYSHKFEAPCVSISLRKETSER